MTFDEQEMAAGRRAGPNLWRWSGLSIEVVENTLELAALDPIVASVQPEFGSIEIKRRVAGPAAGGIGTPEAALAIAFAIAAHGFLSELGKDLYRAFRGALFGAYKKARTWANARGYAPLTVDIVYETVPSVMYSFNQGMDAETFERALQALFRSYADVDRSTGMFAVVMEFHSDSDSWIEVDRI